MKLSVVFVAILLAVLLFTDVSSEEATEGGVVISIKHSKREVLGGRIEKRSDKDDNDDDDDSSSQPGKSTKSGGPPPKQPKSVADDHRAKVIEKRDEHKHEPKKVAADHTQSIFKSRQRRCRTTATTAATTKAAG